MWLKNNILYVCFFCTLSLIALTLGYFILSANQDADYINLAMQCEDEYTERTARLNCWYSVFRQAFQEEGTEKAFDVFGYVYKNSSDFSDSGCHRHAHRMGDIAYYTGYVPIQDLSKMDFPKNANACGYGFYHGFVEHLIQDNPTPEFAEEKCVYLTDRLQLTSPGIQSVCYHASGHGFLMAQADELQDPREWTIDNFTTAPLEQCDSLKTENAHLKSECRQGVLNVFVDWMATEEYGFKYDGFNPYPYCKTLENKDHRYDCYIEMTRKIERPANLNPVEMHRIIQTGDWPEIEPTLLIIAVAGAIMHDPYASQQLITEQCRELPEHLRKPCFDAIVHGLFEHGIPDAEYKLADAYCKSGFLTGDETGWCYDMVLKKLDRFRSQDELRTLCTEELLSGETCSLLQQ